MKCIECGLVAVQDEYNDLPCEATKLVRERGCHQSSNGINSNPAKVFCYAHSPAFPSEERIGKVGVVEALDHEVSCDCFTEWRRGKSPKEHEDMTILQQVEAREQQFREETDKRAEQWRNEEIDRAEKWRNQEVKQRQAFEALAEVRHQETIEESTRSRKWAMAAGVFAIIGTLASAVLTAVLTLWLQGAGK